MLLVLGILITIGLCQTRLVQYMAEKAYFSSETFMTTLAELTAYLKQTQVEDKKLYYKKYENLDNLIYHIEVSDEKGTKIYTNNQVPNAEPEDLREASKFYIKITFQDAYNYLIEKDGEYLGKSSMDFQSAFNRIVRPKMMGRQSEELGYINLDVQYFVLDKAIEPTDFVYNNIEKHKYSYILKTFIFVHLILVTGYFVLITLESDKGKLEGKAWTVFRNVSIELKIALALFLYMKTRTVYWRLIQPNVLMRILYGDMETRIYWIGVYIIGGIILTCSIAWYIVDIVYLLKSGNLKLIKEKSFIIKHKDKILEILRKIGGAVYRVIGIDLAKTFYIKLQILNLLHTFALIFMAIVASDEVDTAFFIGIIYVIIACIGAIGIAWEFNCLKKQVMKITPAPKECAMKFPYIKTLIGLVLYAVALFVLILLSDTDEWFVIITALVIGGVVGIWSHMYASGYKELYDYVQGINERRVGHKPTRSFLGPIIDELSLIDEGFQNAVNKELISQKMKTELISNVSHDLKTPLTSIINYVDLLKKEDLTSEKRQEYIKILDQKSQRLKILIEDLFEASKTASGNLELLKEDIDLVALLKQTLGELAEKISMSTLQFKVNMPEEKVVCELDGKRTYRIFENLIGNILKYAAPHSRVYIDYIIEEEISIVFKNISAYEMNFTADEIIERFKRGDQSRHTEGSGLGLAIAKNLTELQGGAFNITIDGDLFKVIVKFPKKSI